jgi:hypothetical protein
MAFAAAICKMKPSGEGTCFKVYRFDQEGKMNYYITTARVGKRSSRTTPVQTPAARNLKSTGVMGIMAPVAIIPGRNQEPVPRPAPARSGIPIALMPGKNEHTFISYALTSNYNFNRQKNILFKYKIRPAGINS